MGRELAKLGSLLHTLIKPCRYLGWSDSQWCCCDYSVHQCLQMWSARIALLMHLQRFREAELELTAFGELDSPDLFYQYHPHNYPGMKGELVGWSASPVPVWLPMCVCR